MKKLFFGLVSTLVFGAATTAFAGDSPWQIRGRLLAVVPDESATISPIGGDVDIDDSFVPEIDFTYFFTENWAAELILATTPHDVTHTPTGLDLGETWLLPPTVTVQYHFQPRDPSFRPYVGVGVNYTIFFNEGDDAAAGIDVDYDDNFGFALQAGADFPINERWSVNVDVKKIFLNTDVTIEPIGVRADVDIDPLIIGVGLTYRIGAE
jgi:outer membrane protein